MRVLCPCHDDHTPSMQVYPQGMYCWVCRVKLTLDEYTHMTGNAVKGDYAPEAKPKTNLDAGLRYIQTLPRIPVRGLELPADKDGYYIVWPNAKYYKRRNYADGGSKYTNPSGHKVPLLVAGDGNRTLAIVEGELNALSVAKACPEFGVCSPGSAGDLARQEHLPFYLGYDKQIVIVDEDDAGALGAIQISGLLRPHSADVQIMMFKKKAKGGAGDCNEILQEKGKAGLKEEVYKKLNAPLTAQVS